MSMKTECTMACQAAVLVATAAILSGCQDAVCRSPGPAASCAGVPAYEDLGIVLEETWDFFNLVATDEAVYVRSQRRLAVWRSEDGSIERLDGGDFEPERLFFVYRLQRCGAYACAAILENDERKLVRLNPDGVHEFIAPIAGLLLQACGTTQCILGFEDGSGWISLNLETGVRRPIESIVAGGIDPRVAEVGGTLWAGAADARLLAIDLDTTSVISNVDLRPGLDARIDIGPVPLGDGLVVWVFEGESRRHYPVFAPRSNPEAFETIAQRDFSVAWSMASDGDSAYFIGTTFEFDQFGFRGLIRIDADHQFSPVVSANDWGFGAGGAVDVHGGFVYTLFAGPCETACERPYGFHLVRVPTDTALWR